MAEKTLITIKRVCFVFRNIFLQTVYAQSDLGQYCLPLYGQQNYLTVDLGRWYAQPVAYPISGHYRPASETPFAWRFACGPIVARFYVFTGYSQANYKDKDSTRDFGRTTEAYASLCIRAFAARILKQVWRCNFYPKYIGLFSLESYTCMH